jgi:transposase InsO family protein
MQARLDEAQLHARLAWEIVEILSARFRRIPEKHQPYYSPVQRFRVLEIKSLLGWSHEMTARVFLVCPNTISNWHRAADPLAKAVGSLVKPTPPVSRLADAVRATAQLLVRCGMGQDSAALTLARAGWRVSARSVRRIAREPQHPTVPPDAGPPRPSRPVIARFVHHTWMMDVTEIPALLGGQVFHLAGVFDASSRAPLALQLSAHRPRACDVARLLKAAARAFGAPKYLITDLGGEFRGHAFTKALTRRGIKQRFASKLNLYATAHLERFWRTLKDTASLRLRRPLTIEDLERRLEPTLAYYLLHRPHQGLHGATPAEAFLGIEPAFASAVSPPRALPAEAPSQPPFIVQHLDPDHRLPILTPAA